MLLPHVAIMLLPQPHVAPRRSFFKPSTIDEQCRGDKGTLLLNDVGCNQIDFFVEPPADEEYKNLLARPPSSSILPEDAESASSLDGKN